MKFEDKGSKLVEVNRTIWFEAAHRLMTYQGNCKNLHGHSYKVSVSLTGNLSKNGMVVDFKILNGWLKEIIDNLDHATILNKEDSHLIQILRDVMLFRVFVMECEPTAENIALYIKSEIEKRGSRDFFVEVKVWETENSYAKVG